jgi:beta-xylosidase
MKKFCLVNFLFYFIILIAQSQNQTYTNPVLVPGNFNGTNINSTADPHVFRDTDGTYYMYVTGQGYPCFSSTDLVNWKYETNVFRRNTAKWATRSFWAPEVIKIGDKYYLHYTAAREDDIKHIGVAVSNSPIGPFVDMDDKPFIDNGTKGTIDSHVFIDDDGRTYMYYSNAMSTNPVPELGGKKRSEIFVVEIKPDFSGFLSEPVMLIYPQQSWEFNPSSNQYWNEGAVLLKNNGLYYLIFSANCYCAANYAVGYATSTSPMGPFTKSAGNPILSNAGVSHAVSGPGHNSVVRGPDGESWYFVYHSHVHVGNLNSSNHGIRQVNIDRMYFNPDGTISVDGPSISPQPYPVVSNTSKTHYQHLRIYPSVVENELKIDHEIYHRNAIITIKSILGETYQTPVKSLHTIDLSHLSSGIYLVTLTDGAQKYRSKILKK